MGLGIQNLLLLLATIFLVQTFAQDEYVSPCSDVFQYDTSKNEKGKWYGELTFDSEFALNGLWIRVILDGKAQLFGSQAQFIEVKTEDNESFLVKSPDYTLQPGNPIKIPIFVKYDPSLPAPKVKSVRLNARTVCPEKAVLPVGISQCPGIFTYDIDQQGATDRWYGSLRLNSEYELNGVWIRVQLDGPADLLGSEFGEVKSRDNNGFLIFNKNYTLTPGNTLTIPIFVKYNVLLGIPTVHTVRLNARTVCVPFTTESNQLKISIHSTAIPPRRTTTLPSLLDLEEAILDTGLKEDDFGTPDYDDEDDDINNNSSSDSFRIIIDDGPYSCGIREIVDKIFFGDPTTITKFPWHGAIYKSNSYSCGMTLISRNHALSAAHCFYDASRQTIDKRIIRLRFGLNNLRHLRSPEVQTFKVINVYMPSEYKYHIPKYDIAVIKLDKNVLITDSVRPICMWDQDTSLQNIENKNGILVGFGLTEKGGTSAQLLSSQILVVNSDVCRELNPSFYTSLLSNNSFCAGNLTKQTACTGDSGGGLYFQKPGTEIWQIRGIVSTSKPSNTKEICDNSHYSIFTDVTQFKDWIDKQMKK